MSFEPAGGSDHEKNDLRFIKTEENLKNALLELLETNAVSAVSITDICRRA